MKKTILVLSVFLFAASNIHGEDKGKRIDAVFTGEDWNQLNLIFPVYPSLINIERELIELFKTYLIRGVYEGFAAGADLPRLEGYTYKPADITEWYYTETTEEEIVDAVDQFYADYRNTKIPVAYALLVISMELKGEDRMEAEKMLRQMRAEFGVPKTGGRR